MHTIQGGRWLEYNEFHNIFNGGLESVKWRPRKGCYATMLSENQRDKLANEFIAMMNNCSTASWIDVYQVQSHSWL